MFQSEMENLELGLNLRSSDLLFPDDLFNEPLDQLQAQQDALAGSEHLEQGPDLLQSVIDEIKMVVPMEVESEAGVGGTDNAATAREDAEMKSILADYDDLLFEEPAQLVSEEVAAVEAVAASPSGSSGGGSEADDTQSLIEEMEEFLTHHEGGTSVQNDIVDAPAAKEKKTTTVSAEPSLSAADTAQAEQIVQAIVSGDLTLDTYSQDRQRQLAQQTGHGANAIGATISNISEIVTENGETIVIVIANDDQQGQRYADAASPIAADASAYSPSPVPSSVGASPAPTAAADDSDSDWTPDSPVAAKKTGGGGRSKSKVAGPSSSSAQLKGVSSSKRGPYKQRASLSSKYNVRDKKERKKMQNVVAARRYRDKKKGEMADVETQEQELADENQRLTGRLSEMENEVKTLKKLMVELGLVKVSEATAATLSS